MTICAEGSNGLLEKVTKGAENQTTCMSVIELKYVDLAVTLFCTAQSIRVKRKPGTRTFGFPYDQMVLCIFHGQICSRAANARAQSAY